MQALGLTWRDFLSPPISDTHALLDYPAHRGAQLLFNAWRSQVRFTVGRDVPSRPLARVLSNLGLYEPCPGDFRVRLAGHGLRRHFGRDVTGERLPALLDISHVGRHGAAVAALLDEGRPLLMDVRREEVGRVVERFEIVGLRVFAPDDRTPWILAGLFYRDWRL